MSQPINALPDENRYEVVGAPVSYSPQLSANMSVVGSSDVNRNPAISDENQSRVLPPVGVGTSHPLMQDGRYEMIGKNGVTGNIQQVGTPYAVGPQAENIKKSSQYLQDDTNDGPKGNSL